MTEEKKNFKDSVIRRRIYKNVSAKHPDWSRQRKYATVGYIFSKTEH